MAEFLGTEPLCLKHQNNQTRSDLKGSAAIIDIPKALIEKPQGVPTPQLTPEKTFASIASISVQKCRKMRADGSGPEFVKLGKSVRYPIKAIEAYLQNSVRQFTGQDKQSAKIYNTRSRDLGR